MNIFNSNKYNNLPKSFILPTFGVKDQGKDTDKCSFFAIATCFESYSKEELDPNPTYLKAKRDEEKGFILGDAAIFSCKNGFYTKSGKLFINKDLAPFGVKKDFDSIKLAIFTAKQPLVFSAVWKPEWTFSSHGIIQDSINKNGEPHAFTIIGWEKDCLVIQNSIGSKYGNGGLFYFSKEIVNKCFLKGYIFKIKKESTLDKISQIVSSLLKCYNK